MRNFDLLHDLEKSAIRFVRARCDDSTMIGSFSSFNQHSLTLSEISSRDYEKAGQEGGSEE